MGSNYKLINLVDPAKCRAKIKDKFSKLTLSSNKKKQEQQEMSREISETARLSIVSRNLLSELLTDDESDEEKQKQPIGNLLLRTDSSLANTTLCSEVEKDKSLDMEPLLVSAMENTEIQVTLEDEVEKLSSRVSSLAMLEVPITISSDKSPHDVSRIVSTESQKMGVARKSSPILKPICKKEPDVSICISSSSSDGSDSAITISDSSDEENEQEINVSSVVSQPTPETLNTAKADRMAAFLRDVRRNYGLPCNTPDRDFEKRQKEIATADTEPMTVDNDSRSAGTARRIATADTESMTETSLREQIPIEENNDNKRLALNDTEDMTKADESIQSDRHYDPVIKVGPEFLNDSLHKSCGSVPEDSLTIAETSDEDENVKEAAQPTFNGSALKKSDSFSKVRSKSSSISSEHESQVQINISAKINIKIQVSHQMDNSSSSDQSASSQSNDVSNNNSIEEKAQNSAKKAITPSPAIEIHSHTPPEKDVLPEVCTKPDDNSVDMDRAQRILNELYGNTWKTPEVMRSLKKTSRNLPENKPLLQDTKEESVLDDFSIFRRNIPQHLDSTRLPLTPICAFKEPQLVKTLTTPKSVHRLKNQKKNDISIQTPKEKAMKIIDRKDEIESEEEIAVASSEKSESESAKSKKGKEINGKFCSKTPQVQKTRSGRIIEQKWRNIVDSDTESEGENASRDSDKSWSDDDVENTPQTTKKKRINKNTKSSHNDSDLVYLDLSKDEVAIQHDVSSSPPANHDEQFSSRLEEILRSCKIEDKPKLSCTPGSKTKRKLFSANLNEDLDGLVVPFDSPKGKLQNLQNDEDSVSISGTKMPAKFEPFNKYLESVRTGKPIFKIQTPKQIREQNHIPDEVSTPRVPKSTPKTPKSSSKETKTIADISKTPNDKYGFLKSLDVCVGKSLCHPDALYYKENFRLKKDELANKLYEIYNTKCFKLEVEVPIKWNKKLTNTAARCMNKRKAMPTPIRTSAIELSEKVLTSADRLRCTLIHELCHAATWIINGEGGHGATWKAWARKANYIFPELPKIERCHQYDIEYKYTYKCTLCGAKSHAHSKSKKVVNIRCSYCHGAIEIYLNKKDKEGNTISKPVKEPTGFAKFVKDKYKAYKRPDLKHADVMKLLSNEFASMKVDTKQ